MARGAYTAALFEDPDALPPPESHAPVLRTWTGVNRTCDEAHVRPLSSGATSVLPSAHDPRPSSQSWLCHRPDTALAALLDVAASHEEPSITVPSLAHTATVLPSAQSDARSSRKLRQTGTRPTVLFDPEMDQMHFGIEPLSLLGESGCSSGCRSRPACSFVLARCATDLSRLGFMPRAPAPTRLFAQTHVGRRSRVKRKTRSEGRPRPISNVIDRGRLWCAMRTSREHWALVTTESKMQGVVDDQPYVDNPQPLTMPRCPVRLGSQR